VRAARWTFLAHASSKHSPEHHPSSALIDAGQCFTRAAKKLVWSSAAATNPETHSIVCASTTSSIPAIRSPEKKKQ
jgi:hypothetical protein